MQNCIQSWRTRDLYIVTGPWSHCNNRDKQNSVLIIKEGLFGDVEVEGSLGCSSHEILALCWRSKAVSRTEAWDNRRVNFETFKGLVEDILWVRTLEGEGTENKCLVLKHHFFGSSRLVHPCKWKIKEK